MLRRLLKYRNELFTSEEDIRLNEFHNGFLLFLIGWGIGLPLILIGSYVYMLILDFDRYVDLVYWFIVPGAFYLINPIATFRLRFRLKDPFRLTYIALGIQTILISVICILIPQK